MDFTMRAWKKSEGISGGCLLGLLLGIFLGLQSRPGMAENPGINIKYVTGAIDENTYRVNADIDYHFNAEIGKALTHGVALQFDTRFEVKKHRTWFWDKTIRIIMLKYKLQYHPLSGYYLVTNMGNGEHQQFQHLDEATAYLGKLKNYPLVTRNILESGDDQYYGLIDVRLDIQSLPAPLRPLAYLSAQWRLSSQTYAWDIHP
jgi:hypothetical protein